MTVARVSEHAYLSIGDVLDLLKDEFPEITISKIRFLEAQGLIDPERTPSGYRKFYQQDLARLRWILIQQRDHFLPLKVIRDRLEAGTVPEAELVDAGAVFPGAGPSNGFSGGYGSAERSQPDDDVWAAPSPVGERHQGEAGAPEAAASDEVHNGHRDGPSDPDPDLDSAPAPIAAAAGPDADDAHEVGQEPDPEVVGQPAPAFDAAGESGAGAMEPTLFDDAAAPVGKQGTAPVDEIPVPTPELVELAAAAERDDLSGVSLTVTELAAAAAMTVADVRELEKYGLLAGDRVGPEVFYDETALQVAQLAGRFRRHGIEPRHLRQYRVNTDREMSLFEQVVAPYVRQRGRMGHSQASASVHELSDLGESLRRALLKRAARDYLGES